MRICRCDIVCLKNVIFVPFEALSNRSFVVKVQHKHDSEGNEAGDRYKRRYDGYTSEERLPLLACAIFNLAVRHFLRVQLLF